MKKITKSKNFTLIIILLVLVIIFTVWSKLVGKNFFAASTVKNVLQSIIVTSFLTIGAGFLLICGNLDLAMSTIGCFGLHVIACACANKIPGPIAFVMMLVFCAIFGALDGVLVAYLRFPSFIATLGVSYVVKGFMYIYSRWWMGVAQNVNFKDKFIQWFGKTQFLGIPVGAFIMVVFFIIYGILIKKTRFGMKMKLVGGNPRASELAGINSKKLTLILFINGSIMAGIAGMFFGARLGQGSTTALGMNQFSGMTAAMIGGITFGGGVGGMGGAFIGLLILNTFQVGMNVVGVNPNWVSTFSGVLLLIALGLDFIKMNIASAKARRAAKKANKALMEG